jgi:hypothetical protein
MSVEYLMMGNEGVNARPSHVGGINVYIHDGKTHSPIFLSTIDYEYDSRLSTTNGTCIC